VNQGRNSPLQHLRSLLRYQWAIHLAVVVALLGLVAWRINLTHLARSFADAQYGWLIVVTVVYVMSRAVHALEWQITLRKVGRVPYLGLFGALFIGTMVNAIAPANAGDGSSGDGVIRDDCSGIRSLLTARPPLAVAGRARGGFCSVSLHTDTSMRRGHGVGSVLGCCSSLSAGDWEAPIDRATWHRGRCHEPRRRR
jgi:Lysylphosphatidylglycerol synthase TM region